MGSGMKSTVHTGLSSPVLAERLPGSLGLELGKRVRAVLTLESF